MIDKIKARQDLPAILDAHRQRGLRIVLTNGCFDLLHIGHIRYLQSARALGDLLIIAVNSDSSVRLLGKGPGRPIVPEAQRVEVLSALSCVDYVVLFDEANPLEIITFLKPDILAKGGDWDLDQIVGRESVEARRGTVHTLPLVPGTSTTFLIEKIQTLQVEECSKRGEFTTRETPKGGDGPPHPSNSSSTSPHR